jgi:hypothetical protein
MVLKNLDTDIKKQPNKEIFNREIDYFSIIFSKY